MLPTGIYHFSRLSNGVWQLREVVKGSLFLKKQKIRSKFDLNTRQFQLRRSEHGFAKSSIKIVSIPFHGSCVPFLRILENLPILPTGLFLSLLLVLKVRLILSQLQNTNQYFFVHSNLPFFFKSCVRNPEAKVKSLNSHKDFVTGQDKLSICK